MTFSGEERYKIGFAEAIGCSKAAGRLLKGKFIFGYGPMTFLRARNVEMVQTLFSKQYSLGLWQGSSTAVKAFYRQKTAKQHCRWHSGLKLYDKDFFLMSVGASE